mmetsp:Transcript_45036/g.84052  ORF Transcript_45036/g.84052 Transcript_45036/m.84052 type:complete len:228 (-) Transcript_45036:819-1502(-)
MLQAVATDLLARLRQAVDLQDRLLVLALITAAFSVHKLNAAGIGNRLHATRIPVFGARGRAGMAHLRTHRRMAAVALQVTAAGLGATLELDASFILIRAMLVCLQHCSLQFRDTGHDRALDLVGPGIPFPALATFWIRALTPRIIAVGLCCSLALDLLGIGVLLFADEALRIHRMTSRVIAVLRSLLVEEAVPHCYQLVVCRDTPHAGKRAQICDAKATRAVMVLHR